MIEQNELPSKPKSFLIQKIFDKLSLIQKGEITWEDNDQIYTFGKTDSSHLKAKVTILNHQFYKKFIWRGSLGVAESYMDGDWETDNLTALFQIVAENKNLLDRLEKGWSFLGHFLRTFKHLFNYNHIKKNRKNIIKHYDLGNDFFSLFLDKTMMYSSAVFEEDHQNLDRAQEKKLSQICEQLQLSEQDHVLEIGSGWGGFAIYAAQNYGCKITTTTVSDAQYDHVCKQIKTLNLTDKIQIIKKDYRKLSGQFDKLVSIEMIESISHQYFKKYFSICNQLLKPDGLFVLQSIIIDDQEYDRYKREVDFIKTYIFPGGCLPCMSLIKKLTQNQTQMEIKSTVDIGMDYAKTLAVWNQRFLAKKNEILELGFDEKFMRMFEFYFCYCEAGFLSKHISNVQITFGKGVT